MPEIVAYNGRLMDYEKNYHWLFAGCGCCVRCSEEGMKGAGKGKTGDFGGPHLRAFVMHRGGNATVAEHAEHQHHRRHAVAPARRRC